MGGTQAISLRADITPDSDMTNHDKIPVLLRTVLVEICHHCSCFHLKRCFLEIA